MNLNTVVLVIQGLLALCNLCMILFAFKTFLLRPRTNLESRVTEVEVKVKEIDNSLKQGNDRFREQKRMNEVFVSCMLAFIDFEIAFCQSSGYENSVDLMKAKQTLQDYLASK